MSVYNGCFTGILLTEAMKPLGEFFRSFFAMEDALLVRLGKHDRLLIDYKLDLFHCSEHFIHAAAEEGLDAAAQLYSLYTEITMGQTQSKGHPFFERAQFYILGEPVVYRDGHPRSELYPHVLASEYLRFSAEDFLAHKKRELQVVPLNAGYNLRFKLCGALGKEAVDELEELFRRQFLMLTCMTAFLQGLTAELLCPPSQDDVAYCRSIFDRIMGRQPAEVPQTNLFWM